MSSRKTPDMPKKNFFKRLLNWAPALVERFEQKFQTEAFTKDINSSWYLRRVFYVCLFTTLLSAGYHLYKYNVFERQYSKQLISKFNTQLDETFHRYFAMLYGVRGVFSISPNITLRQWRPYSE